MAIRFLEHQRSKPWVVSWKHPYSGRKVCKSFMTEAEAEQFAAVQEELTRKEKAILKKARKTKASISRITVRELLESYFSLAHTNATTIVTARYHAAPVVGAFGGRMPASLRQLTSLTSPRHSACAVWLRSLSTAG